MMADISNLQPEEIIFQAIHSREQGAKKRASDLSKTPTPVSPSHWVNCHYCGVSGRGSGVIRMRVNYTRADGEPVLFCPTYSLCPACNGYGYRLTHIGIQAQSQLKGVA